MEKNFKNRRELINYLKILDFKIGVEVGVRLGQFSKYMLDNTDMIVYSIDPWEINAELGKPKESYDFTINLLKSYGDRSIIIKGYSPQVCDQFDDDSIDFVYIDALHTYESVSADLYGWYNKVKRGGIIAGHDYSKEHWIGVYNAVNDFVEKNNITLNYTGFNKTGVTNDGINDEFDGNVSSWWFIKK